MLKYINLIVSILLLLILICFGCYFIKHKMDLKLESLKKVELDAGTKVNLLPVGKRRRSKTTTPIVVNPVKIKLEDVRELASESYGKVYVVYVHWSAYDYNTVFNSYHINIGKNGEIYKTCNSFTDYLAHTSGRNYRSIGISICAGKDCMYMMKNGKPVIDFGTCPPTRAQVDSLISVIGEILIGLKINPSECTIMTHYEAAVEDNYGPGDGDPDLRWDLWYLPFTSLEGGEYIRSGVEDYIRKNK